jgi:multisubunit Na+/H+ antiporter MnhF subunit
MLTQGLGLDGQRTYQLAAWRFDEGARFDNTFGTWATDYGVALICGAMALRIRRVVRPSALRTRVVALLSLYAASTGVGGAVYQWHTGEHTALNTLKFRLAWTFVVSATLVKGSVLWMIGSELLRLCYISEPIPAGRPPPTSVVGLGACRSPTALHIYSLPDMAWLAWGGILTLIAILGGFSYSRPACDIFVAGTSQAVPSFYVLLALLPWRHSLPARTYRLLQVGLLSNSPLIFVYPWFVQHSGLTLGSINAMLHCVLAFSWTLQGIGLTYVCQLATSPVRIVGPSKMTLSKSMGSTGSVSSTVSTASSLSRTV